MLTLLVSIRDEDVSPKSRYPRRSANGSFFLLADFGVPPFIAPPLWPGLGEAEAPAPCGIIACPPTIPTLPPPNRSKPPAPV